MEARLRTAERLLRELLEIHDLQSRRLVNDYDSVRKIRRTGNRLWEEARVFLSAPPAPSPAPNGKGRKHAADSQPAARA